jgi:hypothetical protein
MLARRLTNNNNDRMSLNNDFNPVANLTLERYDKKMLAWLVQLHNSLNKDQIDIKEVGSLLEVLKHISEEDQDKYLQSLLYPENFFGKIPTAFPVPTSEVREHLTYTFKTSNTAAGTSGGNFCFVYNPYFTSDSSVVGAARNSTFYLNTDTGMDGANSNANFVAREIGQSSMPASMYSTYRLVSCSVTVNYTGRMDIVSGVIGCGIGFNGAAAPGQINVANSAAAAVYGNYNLIDDAYFSQRTQAVNGLRMVYFPLDSAYTNFIPVGTGINGYYFVVYGQGLPADSSCIRVDVYLNFEYTVNPLYSSYVASSAGTCGDTNKAISNATTLIQRNPMLVSQASGDVPNRNNNVSAASGLFGKITGGLSKTLGVAGDIASVIPGVNTLASFLKTGGNILGNLSNTYSGQSTNADNLSQSIMLG